METVTLSEFGASFCFASIYLPDEDGSPAKALKLFYPEWESLFDGGPIALPERLSGAPGDVPRVILQSKDETWRCEIAPARVNIAWQKTDPAIDAISLPVFFEKAVAILSSYHGKIGPRIGRLAGVAARYVLHDAPGVFLARHFCQERWMFEPLNRPESFELHAHKRYVLNELFNVNSWARSKTGVLTGADKEEPLVLFEQDINTVAEEADAKEFSVSEAQRFFSALPAEFDRILSMYYPEGDGDVSYDH